MSERKQYKVVMRHNNSVTLWLIAVFVLTQCARTSWSCSTFAATSQATVDGNVLITHSNDGDGDTAGNIIKVPARDLPEGATRTLSNGFQIPQVSHTFSYLTEGYAIMNEKQVALGETTCSGRFQGAKSQKLNIVDLGKLALERAATALEAVQVMGALSTTYGYYDEGESLLVSDPREVYIFHVLPDDTGYSAIWVAQRVPDGHIAAVMNSFTIRDVPLDDFPSFLYSANLPLVAESLGWDPKSGTLIDFTKTFSGTNEAKCKYSSGRRMWAVYNTFAPSLNLSPFYSDYTTASPSPATIPPDFKIYITHAMEMMRNTYVNTPFSLSSNYSLSPGPFQTPSRWTTPQTTSKGETVCWERSISTHKSIVTLIAQSRYWLPNEIGGIVWFTPHSARAGCFTPFAVGQKSLPLGYTSNTMNHLDRGLSAFWAHKYLYNIIELKSNYMVDDVRQVQKMREIHVSLALQKTLDETYVSNGDMDYVENQYNSNAMETVTLFWKLSDDLMIKYADGFCNGGCEPHRLGYPQYWIDQVYIPPLDTRDDALKNELKTSKHTSLKL